MDVYTTRRQRLAEFVARHATQRQAADAGGIGHSQLSQLLSGHRQIGERLARSFESRAGLPPGWLDGEEQEPAPAMPDAWSVPVPVERSAAQLLDSVRLSARWLREVVRPSSVEAVRIMSVRGDAMRDVLPDGALALVDTGDTALDRDGLVALELGEQRLVRRLVLSHDGSGALLSDPPQATLPLDADEPGVRCIGRVVWAWSGYRPQ